MHVVNRNSLLRMVDQLSSARGQLCPVPQVLEDISFAMQPVQENRSVESCFSSTRCFEDVFRLPRKHGINFGALHNHTLVY